MQRREQAKEGLTKRADMSLPEWCPPYSSRKKSLTTGEDVYCICKKTDSGELMVGCDGCDDWFHFSCLRIPEKYKELVFSFYCPYCAAGVTGPAPTMTDDKIELRRTIWKRKCRLSGCFKACQENSKYCSEEHGEKYMKQALAKLQVSGQDGNNKEALLQKMLSHVGSNYEEFRSFGKSPFANEEAIKSKNPALFDKIVVHDPKILELEVSCQELQSTSIPEVDEKLHALNRYVQWLEDINKRLFAPKGEAHDQTTGNKGNKRRKKKPYNSKQSQKICGYVPHWETIPCTVEEFVDCYDGTKLSIHGVCAKLKCYKHADWSSMTLEQYTNQLRSLQSHRERLKLLIKTRKEQLLIQYYEQLLMHGKN